MSRRFHQLLALAVCALPTLANAGSLDVHLARAADHATPGNAARLSANGLLRLNTRRVGGQPTVYASAILELKTSAIPALQAMGVQIHTVVSNGIATADIPVHQLRAVAARADVGKVEAGKAVRKYNFEAQGLHDDGAGTTWGMNNPGGFAGEGVIIGVIDSGLDYTHGDFVDDVTGDSRILYYWDQSDPADLMPPAGAGWSFSYGHEYVQQDFNNALDACAVAGGVWDQATNFFCPVDLVDFPIRDSAGDYDGHGTHVTGSVGGDGSASGQRGSAWKSDIVFVKFDFDNAADRNTDAAIIDGIDYIFKRATELGRPAVINMSLGSDFGPHDGTSNEERGVSGLVDAGKVVVVAAGNPGSNNWSDFLGWGFAMHFSGNMTEDKIQFRVPAYAVTGGDYVFFDIWYDGAEETQVQITTPSGAQYPSNFGGRNRRTWTTGSAYSGFNTPEGALLVANGGDQLGWGTTNGDHEIYIEISDYYGTAPAEGEFIIDIIPRNGAPAGGRFDGWFGVSSSFIYGYRAEDAPRDPTPKVGNDAAGWRESDNAVTIGAPASADRAIAVAAYMSRDQWDYYDGATDGVGVGQRYENPPIGYYDPFALGELAYFSGRGPRRDGVMKPEIAAPGVGIASSYSHFSRYQEWPDRGLAYPAGPYHFGTNRVTPNLEGTILQGTSMACPSAAGAIALLLQVDPTLDDAGLRALFAATARHDVATDTPDHTPGTARTDTDMSAGAGLPNNDWGYGKLDIAAALAELGPCLSDLECDDGNDCTTDSCDAGACVNAAKADDSACGVDGICCAGSCVAAACGADADCDDGSECTTDSCTGAGTCAATCNNDAVADGTACGAGLCCGGSCAAPACEIDADCNDNDACTDDSCIGGGACGAVCANADNGQCLSCEDQGLNTCSDGVSCGLLNRDACSSDGDCCSNSCRRGSCKGN